MYDIRRAAEQTINGNARLVDDAHPMHYLIVLATRPHNDNRMLIRNNGIPVPIALKLAADLARTPTV